MSKVDDAIDQLRARGCTNEKVLELLKALMKDNDPFLVTGVYMHTHQLVEFLAKTMNEFRGALDVRAAKIIHAR